MNQLSWKSLPARGHKYQPEKSILITSAGLTLYLTNSQVKIADLTIITGVHLNYQTHLRV